jgi:1,2-diacylglycerol 3-alpha-glucosyltransferase
LEYSGNAKTKNGDEKSHSDTIIRGSDVPLIGQYIDSYLPAIDGVIITVQNYAHWLNEDHFPCYVATTEAKRGFQDTEPYSILRYRSIPLLRRPPYRFGLPVLDRRFRSAQHQIFPDLVHAHSPFFAGAEARRLARRRDIPLVASFHSKYYEDILHATGSSLLAQKGVERIISFYNHADAVWTVNQATAGTLRDYGFKKEIEIMPNGTDMTLDFNQELSRARINKRLGLDPTEKVILFVGQHILQKNLMMLLDSIKLYAQKNSHFKLLMVGDGYARSALIERAAELGLSERVIFTGIERDRDVLSDIYHRADLFAFPSLYDNSALVVKEAATAGCPSVLIEGSNVAEGTIDGYNAYLCQNDAQSLCDAINRALSMDTERKTVGQMAQMTLAKPWRSIMNDVADRYRAIMLDYKKGSKLKKR